ncbi:MAG: Gfo/Idh/MocA family oxidoreductase [Planctomycetes bacterium]|nr:Gfo/Idh/MocA family oxidoreductase [Planctomycetota bacterium]
MLESTIVRVGLIGAGGIAAAVHYPGLKIARGTRIMALADTDAARAEARAREWQVEGLTDPEMLVRRDDIDAVVIATPNVQHAPLALCAARHGKHVLCEKPLAMNLAQAQDMLSAARRASVRHMTAFTYRFVPAMRYLKHLLDRGSLGTPRHFRAQRFQDLSETCVGWRQWRDQAGTGELGDMASHRIDYGHYLIGEIRSVCGVTRQFLPRDRDREGRPVRPSDTDDWAAILGEFEGGVTGVWESTRLARGHSGGTVGHDFVEVNGSEASAIYQLRQPYEILIGRGGRRFEPMHVPAEFLKHPESPRVPGEGDPAVTWRYDQAVEFISAIREGRDCRPSFLDGTRCQAVIDAVLRSQNERRWVEVERVL